MKGKGRKIGRAKDKCKRYKLEGRRESNKMRLFSGYAKRMGIPLAEYCKKIHYTGRRA